MILEVFIQIDRYLKKTIARHYKYKLFIHVCSKSENVMNLLKINEILYIDVTQNIIYSILLSISKNIENYVICTNNYYTLTCNYIV